MAVSAQKTGPRYVSPRGLDDDGDLSSDLLASAAAGRVVMETTDLVWMRISNMLGEHVPPRIRENIFRAIIM